LSTKCGEDLAADLRRESITSIASNAPNNQEAFREVWKYFESRIEYFRGSVLLTNVCTLSMVSSCFEYLFDGPVRQSSPLPSLPAKHGIILCSELKVLHHREGVNSEFLMLFSGVLALYSTAATVLWSLGR